MASVSPNELMMNTRLQIKSFSLPSNSNRINIRIQQELERLKTKEASSTSPAEIICIRLSVLADLYSCINQSLSLPLTQQALSLHQHEQCVIHLLKRCSNLHRICSSTRDIVLQLKELALDTQSALDMHSSDYESKVACYISSRKEIIKRVKALILSSKQFLDHSDVSIDIGSSTLFQEDHCLSTVIKALTCIGIIKILVFESLQFFLSIPLSKPKSGSLVLVSKSIHKTEVESLTQRKLGTS